MPYKGFTGVTSITGIEEFISMTITGELTEIVIDPGTANTAPTVTTYYNPRYNISIEGISSGASVGGTFTVGGATFVKTAENYTSTVGDVVKVSVTGINNPNSALGT
jgi:hypothetical protein